MNPATQTETDQLIQMLHQASHLHALARYLEVAGPPDCWLAAGCVVQSIWNLLTQRPPDFGILDYDVVYFDPDLTEATEQAWQARLSEAFADLKPDVKNQARVHQWYPRKFGLTIAPYKSVADAMQTWPTTATATAARLKQGQWQVLAPFGLTDLLALVLRPNRTLASEQIYRVKALRWAAHWPELRILPWEQAITVPQKNQGQQTKLPPDN